MKELDKTNERMDELLKSLDALEKKIGPVAQGALRGAAVGAVTGGVKGALGAHNGLKKDSYDATGGGTSRTDLDPNTGMPKVDYSNLPNTGEPAMQGVAPKTQAPPPETGSLGGDISGSAGRAAGTTKAEEVLEKPPVSEAQRRAMHAAASGNSTLGIPASVGKDFADADAGGKLPETKKEKKARKALKKANKGPESEDSKTGKSHYSFTTSTSHKPDSMQEGHYEVHYKGTPVGHVSISNNGEGSTQLSGDHSYEHVEHLAAIHHAKVTGMNKADDNTNGKQHFDEKFYPGQADLQHSKDDANNQDNVDPNNKDIIADAKKPKKEKEATLNADNDGKLEKRPDTANKASGDPETDNFLEHFNPSTKHPKEPTAGMAPGKKKGERTASTGIKLMAKTADNILELLAKMAPGHTDNVEDEANTLQADKAEKTAADGAPKKPPAAAGATPAKPEGRTIDYAAMKPVKANEANAATINYGQQKGGGNAVTRTPAPDEKEQAKEGTGFKTPKEKYTILKDPKFRSKLAEQRRAAGVKKTDYIGSDLMIKMDSNTLTKSLRKSHSDQEIGMMIKAAVDSGVVHRNVLLEWNNYHTVNPAILAAYDPEE